MGSAITFAMKNTSSYLLDAWVPGSGNHPTTLYNPTTGEALGTCSNPNTDLSLSFAFARDHAHHLRNMKFNERAAILDALSKAMHSHRDALIELSIETCGTTRSDAKFDIDGASGTLAFYAALGKSWDKKTWVEPTVSLTKSARFVGNHIWSAKRGVAIQINAFNFPAWGMAEKFACSFLAGMPALSKPGTSTVLLAEAVAKRWVDTGVLPKGSFQFLAGSFGDALSHLQSQDVIAFTGSSGTAKKLRNLPCVTERSTRITIEADSINAMLLGETVEEGSDIWNTFVRDAIKEITQKSGQKCTATRRIFVPTTHASAIKEALVDGLSRIKVGDPAISDTQMGPLSNQDQHKAFYKGLQDFMAAGCKLIVGTTEPENTKGYFVKPTLLEVPGVSSVSLVHQHEIFGPCATLIPYSTEEEAALGINLGDGGLVVSLYGSTQSTLEQVAPYHGRVLWITEKVADQAIQPGMVLPASIHGGPGRAGGGEELGGEHGLKPYMQHTAIQGDKALIEKL